MADSNPKRFDFFEWFEAWVDKMRRFLLAATMLAILVVALITVMKGVLNPQGGTTESNQALVNAKEIEQLRKQLSQVEQGQQTLVKTLSSLQPNASQYATLTPSDRQALNQLIEGQKGLDSRLKELEDALRLDVTKALAVPLMRKDVDALQEKTKSDLSLIQNEIGRLFSLAQWFLGAVVTIALAVISLILTNRKKDAGSPGTSK